MVATAFMSSVVAAAGLLVVVGFASILFLTTGNSTIPLAAPPPYRGRVTALWSTAFVGSTPIGAGDPRLTLVVGAAVCGAAGIAGLAILADARRRRGLQAQPVPVPQK